MEVRKSSSSSGKRPNQREARQKLAESRVAQLLKRFDKNQDGLLDADEVLMNLKRRFAKFDTNKDGQFSKPELLKMQLETNTRPARDERHSDTLQVGDPAPDFTLLDPQGKRKVTLSDFRGKKPVVLIFGSYT